MKLKIIYFTLLTALISFSAYSQTGTLSGTVKKANNETMPYATVQIINPIMGISADANGNFIIKDVPVGERKLKITSVGFVPITKTVTVTANKNETIDFILKEDVLNLNEVVVSGTRYGQNRKESAVIVSVLTPKILQATQSIALSEGLNYQPGVRVETNCQNCGFSQVRINGLQGAYSQILMNSRPIFSALNSVYGLDQIPTNIVERVEVVRSGGSALYGSNAIAGTINIITKDPIENGWQIGSNFALIDGESFDRTVNFNSSIVSEDLSSGVTFYGMNRNRESYDANGDGFTELTSLENNTFGAKAFYKPGEQSKITFDFNAIKEYRRGGDRLNLAPHFTDITEELDHNTIFTGLTYDWYSKDNKNKVSAYISAQHTQRDSYYGGLGGERTAEDSLSAVSAYGDTRDDAVVSGLTFTRIFNEKATVIVGAENNYSKTEDKIEGYNRLIDQEVNAIGFYGQLEYQITPTFKTLLGARYDNSTINGQYEVGDIARTSNVSVGAFSPRLTLLYDVSEYIQLRGGYARGFRAPQAFSEDLHIASVGGEPSFVLLTEGLEKELSDAFTASVNYTKEFGKVQTNFLIEGFYTELQNPFTIVSTGSVLPNGSILEETRNGEGATVSGVNFEASISPSKMFTFQAGGTVQQSEYKEEQVLFEPEVTADGESIVTINEFARNPNTYGYFATNYKVNEHLSFDFTGTYTGSMIVPLVAAESGFLDLKETDPFYDMNFKVAYHFDLNEDFHLELSTGVQNFLNSYQDDFSSGATRDSDYVYGPSRPRTFFVSVKIGSFH